MYSGIFLLSFAADELRCWRSAERTAGRENQELGAESVSAATRGLFTVSDEPYLGGFIVTGVKTLPLSVTESYLHVYLTFNLHPK